jgi:hypothetical protein
VNWTKTLTGTAKRLQVYERVEAERGAAEHRLTKRGSIIAFEINSIYPAPKYPFKCADSLKNICDRDARLSVFEVGNYSISTATNEVTHLPMQVMELGILKEQTFD